MNLPEELMHEIQDDKKDYSSFDNYSKKRVTLIGYLLAIKEDSLSKEPFDQNYLATIKGIKDIEIIRALCSLRLNFLLSYDKIFKEKQLQGPFAQFDKMDKLIDVKSLKYLQSQKIDPLEYGIQITEFTKHIANINYLIETNIESIHQYIPEWIEWNYIKDLFIMPNCSAGANGCNCVDKKRAAVLYERIHEIRKSYYANFTFYPYKAYVNWNPKKMEDFYGNILFNDSKFLKLVYASHGDTFKGEQYVVDAKDSVKNSIYDFVEKAINIGVFVDCENVDPYHFAAALMNLDKDKIKKINNIVLYDDVNTANAWDMLETVLNIPITHVEVDRLKEDKSLVDHAMSIGVTKSYYTNQTESVIIVSSDSDFWSLIAYLPDIHFFVMNETRITSHVVINKLDDYNIPHCYMDEFAQDVIQPFKNLVLKQNLESFINDFNENGNFPFLSVDELVDEMFHRACIPGHYRQIEKEKQDFFNKYIKKLKLVIVDEDDEKRFKLIIS